jgi:hypothetical protein
MDVFGTEIAMEMIHFRLVTISTKAKHESGGRATPVVARLKDLDRRASVR